MVISDMVGIEDDWLDCGHRRRDIAGLRYWDGVVIWEGI